MSKGRAPGPRVQGVSRMAGKKGNGDGNNAGGGIESSASQDYTYKLCFLACSVHPADLKVHFIPFF